MPDYFETESEEERRQRRAKRLAKMKREKKKRAKIIRCIKVFAVPAVVVLVICILAIRGLIGVISDNASASDTAIMDEKKADAGDGNPSGANQDDVNSGEAGFGDGNSDDSNSDSGNSGEANSGGGKSGEAGFGDGNSDDSNSDSGNSGKANSDGENQGKSGEKQSELTGDTTVYTAKESDSTVAVPGEVVSSHALLIDLSTNEFVAQRDPYSRISPASMTKILTLLVAAEHVENLDDTFTITFDITDFSYTNDCSNVGFEDGETVTVRDLMYGTILPSGADAAVGLATYVAGSQEEFVKLMNEKIEQLGLSETAHFTNCVGIYDENLYCTTYDMAMILDAAIHNDLCREVLSAHTYTTTATSQHPEGLILSNWFLRRIEDKDCGGTVLCAKTGYVVQSGNCAASYGEDAEGNGYICVTADSSSSWRCIYDHVAIYKQFMKP